MRRSWPQAILSLAKTWFSGQGPCGVSACAPCPRDVGPPCRGPSPPATGRWLVGFARSPGRSLTKVAQKLDVSDTYVGRLSSRFHWVSRSTEWDREQDRSRRDRLEAECDEMNARHAHLAETVFAKVTEAVTSLDTKKLAPNQIAKLMEVSIKTERLARGESAETAAVEPAGIRADEVRSFLRAAGLIDQPPDDSQPDSSNDERLGKWLEGELDEGVHG